MSHPGRARGRTDEPWERGLYLLLLVVAIVVILYSLFGIATLLGYLPLSQSGVGGRETHHPDVEVRPALDRIKDRPLTGDTGGAPCPRRTSVKVAALAPPVSPSTFVEQARAECAQVESNRPGARNARQRMTGPTAVDPETTAPRTA